MINYYMLIGYKEILPKYSFFNEGTQFEFINDTYTRYDENNIIIHVSPTIISYRVNWVIQKGIKYQEGAAVVIGVEDEELVFGQIIAVYIVMEQILLLINLLKTVEFDQRRNAYVVTRKNEYYYTWPSDLDFRVFGVYLISNSETLETRYHIVLKYNVLT